MKKYGMLALDTFVALVWVMSIVQAGTKPSVYSMIGFPISCWLLHEAVNRIIDHLNKLEG